jgi:fibronectin type III domain protein
MGGRVAHADTTLGGVTCSQTDLQNAIDAGGTVTFSADCTIQLASALVLPNTGITIDGNGHTVVLDGQGATRIFESSTGGEWSLFHLTLENGYAGGGASGGAIHLTGGILHLNHDVLLDNTTDGNGGAIDAAAYVEIYNSALTGNTAEGSGQGGAVALEGANGVGDFAVDTFSSNSTGDGGNGGAFAELGGNGGTSIERSTFDGNSVGVGGNGGAIYTTQISGGPGVVENSTLTGNSVGSGGDGSALYVSGSEQLSSATLANNSGAEALFAAGASSISNIFTIFSGNGADCGGSGSLVDFGYNLSDTDGSSCGFSGGNNDTVSTAANLGQLADYGGPTKTMALQATSPSAARSTGIGCLTVTDERGVSRGSACSIGAFQWDASQQYVGTCDETTLDAAVASATAQADFGATTVKFGCDGTITLTSTIDLPTGVTPGTRNVTLDGNGHSVTIDGGGDGTPSCTGVGLFTLGTLTFTIDGLTLAHTCGDAVYSSSGSSVINLNDSLVEGAYGAAIQTSGTANVTNTTIANNLVDQYGVVNGFNSPVSLTGDTLVNNTDVEGYGYDAAVTTYNGAITLQNDLFYGNGTINSLGTPLNCYTNGGAITDNGSNFSDGGGGAGDCGFSAGSGDVLASNPQLGPLQNNGGPTDTYAITQDSPPAVAYAQDDCGLSTDQRGVTRPTGNCSIGAYQFDASTLTVSTCDESHLDNAVAIAALAGSAATVDFACDGTIDLTSSIDLPDAAEVTIDGSGHSVVLDGQNGTKMFRDVAGTGDLTLNDLTLQNGHGGTFARGGAIQFETGGTLTVTNSTLAGNSVGDDGRGGAINAKNVVISGSTLTGNSAAFGDVGGAVVVDGGSGSFADDTFASNTLDHGQGGAVISLGGTVAITGSTFVGNTTGGGGSGGALQSYGSATVTNSTFSGNSSGGTAGAIGRGGSLTLTNDTFVGNESDAALSGSGPLEIGWTLFSGNGTDCSGAVTADDGYNLTDTDGTSCGFDSDPSDAVNTAANLAALGDYGGPTKTAALQATSPAAARDSGADCGLSADQRGTNRPSGHCSVGAFQYDPSQLQTVGTCDTASVTGALDLAAAATAPTTVRFACDGTVTTGSEIDIPATGVVTVDGNGHTVALSGGDDHPLFVLAPGGAALTVDGLTLEHFLYSDYPGGTGVVQASNGDSVTIANSTIRDNTTVQGVIDAEDNTAVTVTNSTIANNTAIGGPAVFDGGFGSATFSADTIVGNTGPDGVINAPFETMNFKDVLLAGNAASGDVCGFFGGSESESYNLADDASGCGFTNGVNNDVVGVGAQTMPLDNYGGPTDTVALQSTSPAIDAGSCTDYFGATLAFDQRGVARPRDATCDIGAYEAIDGPVTSFHITPASPNGSNGWYKIAPHVTLSAGAVHGATTTTTYYAVVDAPAACAPDALGGCSTYSGQFALPDGTDSVTYFSQTDIPAFEGANVSATYDVDTTAPTTTIDLNGYTAGKWTNGDVQFSLNPTDATSGVASTSYAIDQHTSWTTYSSPVTISTEGKHAVYFRSVDNAGNTENFHAVAVNIDKTAPLLAGAPTTSPNGNGWYHGNVKIHWTCSDALSGIAHCPGDSTISSEGTGLTAGASDSDNAGNTTPATSSPAVQIDKTAPTTTGALSTSGYHTTSTYEGPVTLTLTPSDALSGVDTTFYSVDGGSPQTYSAPVPYDTVGSHTFRFWSTDLAGNTEVQHLLTALVIHKPAAPTLGTVTRGVRSLGVSWTAPADTAGEAVKSYVITYVNQTTTGSATKTVLAPASSTTLTGLANGTSYSVSVQAKNDAGLGAASSSQVQSTYGLPAPPTSFAAALADGGASLSWQPSASDGGTPITSYALTIVGGGSTTNQSFDPGTACTVSGCSANVTGLTNGVNYSLRLSAVNAVGKSTMAQTTVVPYAVPGSPTSVGATGGPKKVVVTWEPPSATGGGVTKYTVTLTGGVSPVVMTVSASTACSGDPCTATVGGLADGTMYTVTVKAVNPAGASAPSSSASAVTSGLGPPTSFVAVPGSGVAHLSWHAPAGDGGHPVADYRILVYIGSTLYGEIDSHCVTATCNLDTSPGFLHNGTTYTLNLSAYNGVAFSASVSTTVTPN